MNDKGLTVLVCTYNGAERLPATLAHLAAQVVSSHINWEVIVVDNASTDDSAGVARNEWAKQNLPDVGFKVLTESIPGKINALATGTSASRYEYFIICDDDNWLSPDYVQETYTILEKDASIGAVGGQSIPRNDSGIFPAWFNEYAEGYAVGEQGGGIAGGDITESRGYLWGAGLGTRTKLYKDIFKDFPSLLTGRNGKKLSAGEDSEYSQRLILKGYKLFYDPKLVLYHYLPAKRLEETYREKLFAGFTESEKILDKYYIATEMKIKLDINQINKYRLLVTYLFKALFTSSPKKRLARINMMKYILNRRYPNDPVLEAIRAFEKGQ